MKQKRKVKSLIPQRNDLGGSLLTATLLVLGLALCLGSASLMTSSVGAASSNPDEYSQFQYSGTDDKVEVLYNLQFSKPEYLSGFVGEMYTDKNNDFYITSTPITVNESGVKAEDVNEVDKGLYSNILGGHKNKVHSNYVTTIGGEENVIATGNPNAVIFGGKNNEISGSAAGNPSAIVGGHHNLIKGGHNGNTIIGGHDNSISGSVSNSFILGGISNKIVSDKGINNVIVGGSYVTVDTGDVFVFSDSAFKPEGNKTFYLNVSQGLGINAESKGKGVTVNGPVKFGEIDITKPEYPCDSNHYGIIGSWNGCLVGCTPTTAVEGKWDLLDRGERCQKDCDSPEYINYCSQKKPEVDEPEAYSGFCTDGVNTGNASPCTPVWDEVKDVVFETALINSVQFGGKCPGADAVNKCIYQCNSGYYLTGDLTKSDNVKVKGQKACYSICDLSIDLGPEWVDDKGNPIILKHNEMVTGYNTNDTTCARTKPYEDPGDKYGKDKGTKGDDFPEHCGNNQHKQPLVCVNGKMEIAKDFNNPESKNQNAAAKGYIHRNCAVHEFTCDTTPGKFDLRRDYITTTLLDNSIVKDTPKDRDKMIGTRGTYKLCLDYDVLASPLNEKVPGNETCNVHLGNNKPYVEHYKFEGCNAGYHRSTRPGETDKYICRKDCVIDTNMGKKTVYDNKSIILYKGLSNKCEDNKGVPGQYICQEHTFTCDDGEWKVEDRPYIGQYTYTTCTQQGVECPGYDVPANKINREHTTYQGPCHRWYAFNNGTKNVPTKKYETQGGEVNGYSRKDYTSIQDPCIDGGDYYLLEKCDPCWHTTNDEYCNQYDVIKGSTCSSSEAGKIVKGYTYSLWNTSSWRDGKMETRGKCDSYCDYDNDYYDCGSSCCKNKTISEIQESCDSKPEGGTGLRVEVVNTTHSDGSQWFYYDVYSTTGSNSGFVVDSTDECFKGCDSTNGRGETLRRAGTSCELKYQYYKCVGTLPAHAEVVSSNYHRGTVPMEYYYNKKGGDCAFRCVDGYEYDSYYGACLDEAWQCGAQCSHDVSFDPNGGTIKGSVPSEVGCPETIHMPDVERSCHKFLGWDDGSNGGYYYKIGQSYSVTTNISFTAQWERDTSLPGCDFDCLDPKPSFDSKTMERSDKKPEWDGEHWTRVTHNGELQACQWRCKPGYILGSDGLSCVEKPCQTSTTQTDNPPTSDVGIVKGPGTYVGTDTRTWRRITSGTPVACQWRCADDYQWNASKGICEPKIAGKCETIAKGYCSSGSTVDSKVNLTVGTLKSGEKWKCKGTTSTSECAECLPGYKKTGNSYTNYKCDVYNCKTPAPSGEGVLKGATTYTGENVVDNKGWDYLTGKNQSELKACEWSCKTDYIKSGNTCVKHIEAACSKPEEHYHCEDDTTMKAEDKEEIKVSGKFAGYKWTCKGTGGGEDAYCIECDEEHGFQVVGEGKNRTCAKDQDGECDYSQANTPACKSGELAIQTDESDAEGGTTVWNCEGIGNGKRAVCGVRAYCGGTCEALHKSECNNLGRSQSQHFDVNKRSHCVNAGWYGNSISHGDGRCYLNSNVFPSMGINACSSYGSYGACFKWENGSAVCEVLDNGNWTTASSDKCKPIENKIPEDCSPCPSGNCDSGGDFEHVYHAEVVGTQGNDAMIRVWTDYNVPKDVTFKIHYKYNIGGWFQHDVDITIPAGEDMASSSWLYVGGRNGCDVRIDHTLQSDVVVKDGNDTHTFVYEGGDDCERKIPVTVEYHWLTPQRYYSDFLLIKAEGGHVQSNCSLVGDNNGTHGYCSFEVPADWIGKKVGTQFTVHDANGYGFSTAQASNDDWVITDYYTKLNYYTQI